MNKKKLTPLVLTGGGILISVFVIIASYAYWQVTKKQASSNNMIAACLDIEMKDAEEGNTGISLQSAWPISDEEGRNGKGYTFTVENKCNTDVNYIIALESLEDSTNSKYLDYKYVKLAIDDEIEQRYGSLDIIDNVIEEGDTEKIRETREVTVATVAGNTKNSHTIKLWLSSDAPLEEQNSTFRSRIRITGGQGIAKVETTPDSCFQMDETTGEITKYLTEKEECGESVVIPATVNGTKVKSIDSNAFKDTITKESITYHQNGYTIEENADYSMVVDEGLMQGTGKDAYYFVVYKDSEIVQNRILDWKQAAISLGITHDIPVYYAGVDPIPELVVGQEELFAETHEEGEDNFATKKVVEYNGVIIKSLDLSNATNLEMIEDSAFSNVPSDVTDLDAYSNYLTSLTSLTFGKNTNSLSIGTNAFANIDVENLEVYTSYIPVDDTSFAKSNINNLTIKATDENKKISSKILNKIIVNNLTIDEGIEELSKDTSSTGELRKTKINTLILPTTLNHEHVDVDYLSQYMHNGSDWAVINNLVINTPIDSVGDSAFYQTTIKNIILPETVKSIGKNAFSHSKTESINLSEGLTSIDENAFYSSSIKSINIPSSVTRIESYAFALSAISNITFENSIENPAKLNSIGASAFQESQLKEITIPSTVRIIDFETFRDCNKLESVTFEDTDLRPSQLNSIYNDAFNETAIMDLIIPSSVSYIGERAFRREQPYDKYLRTIVFENTAEEPAKISRILEEAFYGNRATNIIIPASITEVGGKAFANNPLNAEIYVDRASGTFTETVTSFGNATVSYKK